MNAHTAARAERSRRSGEQTHPRGLGARRGQLAAVSAARAGRPDQVRLRGILTRILALRAEVPELQADPRGLAQRQCPDIALGVVERRPPVIHDRAQAQPLILNRGVEGCDPRGGEVPAVLLVGRAHSPLGSPLEQHRSPRPLAHETVKAQFDRPLPVKRMRPRVPHEQRSDLDASQHRVIISRTPAAQRWIAREASQARLAKCREAVDTHNSNHPTTDHDCADLSRVDPSRYPRTDVLLASPECTNHSQAKGRTRNVDAMPDLFGDTLPDEAAERSRATMWDVVRFAEHHRYAALVVENVVDAALWVLWPAWRSGLDALGYCTHVGYLNSMHAQAGGLPAPQSRDRLYVVAHLRKTNCPDLNRWTQPMAYCPGCDRMVRAMQAWKKPERTWGRYRAQYAWRCPNVACRNQTVEAGWLPAAAAIDWSLVGERIGDRARPLADKTMQRIRAGLARYARPELLVPVEGRDGKPAALAREAMRTMTTRNETALLVPVGGTWNET
jgi:site-specific DNA-cytosine methylase